MNSKERQIFNALITIAGIAVIVAVAIPAFIKSDNAYVKYIEIANSDLPDEEIETQNRKLLRSLTREQFHRFVKEFFNKNDWRILDSGGWIAVYFAKNYLEGEAGDENLIQNSIEDLQDGTLPVPFKWGLSDGLRTFIGNAEGEHAYRFIDIYLDLSENGESYEFRREFLGEAKGMLFRKLVRKLKKVESAQRRQVYTDLTVAQNPVCTDKEFIRLRKKYIRILDNAIDSKDVYLEKLAQALSDKWGSDEEYEFIIGSFK